jgi:formamidopyrimidine-DNA glycosylase
VLDPVDAVAGGFTFERFAAALQSANRGMKSVLVGKEAVLVGISNSTFQDVLYRARIHPRRKASSLSAEELKALFEVILVVVTERLRLGGKQRWFDLYGRPGGYVAAMGPGMEGRVCTECGSTIEKLALGGGEVHVCPVCQR